MAYQQSSSSSGLQSYDYTMSSDRKNIYLYLIYF